MDVKYIKKYNLRKKYVYEIKTSLHRGVALDYDVRTGTVFYTDVHENKIYSSQLNVDSKQANKVRDDIIEKTVETTKNHLIHNQVFFSYTKSYLCLGESYYKDWSKRS